MIFYFLLIRIAAFFGHKKARALVRGQRETVSGDRLPVTGAIWFHAASVGEFEQARPLIERLRLEHPEQKIVVTFFSPSGYEARKDYAQADGVYYLPFATRRNAKRFLNALQPKMAIFVKYEFWPAYIRELKKRGIPTYSICSIFRKKQVFFRWWGKPYLKTLKRFTHLFVQDEASRALLAAHGVTQVTVAGDTRFDRMMEVRSERVKELRNERLAPIEEFVRGCERVIVAGSTWPEDEKLLAKYIEDLRFKIDDCPQTKLILVPHEIDEAHLQGIFNLFQGRMVKYSSVVKNEGVKELKNKNIQYILQRAEVMVVDTMGLLSSIYPYGQVAYIGGGFGAGIHNTIEAAAYGMPVVFGPNYDQFREAHDLIAVGAARSIKNDSELEAALCTALEQHAYLGAKAAEYVQSELGTSAKIYEQIFENYKIS